MKRTLLTGGLLMLAAASQASAETLTFTNRGTWTSEVTSLINFDGGTQAVNTSSTIVNGGVYSTNLQINGYDLDTDHPLSLIRANAGATSSYYNWGTGTIIRTQDKTGFNTPFARISFAAPVSAFGFNFGVGGCPIFFNGCLPGAAGSVTIAPNGMTPIGVNTVQANAFAFFGVTSDTQTFAFADIYINDTNRYLVLDDIAHGSIVQPPPPENETAEPDTLLQLALGGILLAMARRRFGLQRTQAI